VVARLGGRIGFTWLLVASGALGLFVPRDELPGIGPPLFVIFGLVLVFWVANRRRRRWTSMRSAESARAAQRSFGRAGEDEVRGCLVYGLPEDYVLINGLTLPKAAGDVDHLVVGPSGLFLLETKMMAGHIVCSTDGTWRRTKLGRGGTPYSAYIGDPAAQVQRNIFAVRHCLRRRVPQLVSGTSLWVEGLVVFPHPKTELSTEHSRVPAIHLRDAVAHICQHQPQRVLRPHEVVEVVGALLSESRTRPVSRAAAAQALVEFALALPMLLALLFGTVALSRVVQAHSAIVAVAHDVARAGALASSPADARERMQERFDAIVPGLGLDRAALDLASDVSAYARTDGRVTATVRYVVDLGDVPVIGWAPPPTLRAQHQEWIDPFRGGISDAAEEPH
jgi:nuclease-like protein/TadE-like protein